MPIILEGQPGAEELKRRDPAFGIVPERGLRRLLASRPIARAILALLIAYEVNGVDVSKWNGLMNWLIAASRGLTFAYFRGGFGERTKDGQVDNNRANIAPALDWGLYWFLYIGETSWRESAKGFFEVWKEGGGRLYPCLDCEYTILGLVETAAWIYSCYNLFEDLAGEESSLYTAPGWWNSKVGNTSWARTKKLIVAHWTTAPTPIIPLDWSKYDVTWWGWQHSADGNGLGVYYGAPPPPEADRDMDLDRYNGTLAAYRKEFPLPPPEEEMVIPYVSKQEIVAIAGSNTITLAAVPAGQRLQVQSLHLFSTAPVRASVTLIAGGNTFVLRAAVAFDGWNTVALPPSLSVHPVYILKADFLEAQAGAKLQMYCLGDLYVP